MILLHYIIFSNGQTSLISASENGHIKVVKYLIAKKAKIEANDNDNFLYYILK